MASRSAVSAGHQPATWHQTPRSVHLALRCSVRTRGIQRRRIAAGAMASPPWGARSRDVRRADSVHRNAGLRADRASQSRDVSSALHVVNVGLSLRREIVRKGLHLISTIVPISYAAGVSRAIIITILALLLAAAMTVELARFRSTRVQTVFDARLGGLLREHEWRGLSGATWLIVALLLASVFFPQDVAIAAMGAVALG